MLQYSNTIESKRLILMPMNVDIIDYLLESNDVFLSKYGLINDGGEFLNPSPDYLIKLKNTINNSPKIYPLAVDYMIIVKDIKTVIGTIYFKQLPVNGVSEVGYGMNLKYEGNGYMSEALNMLIEYGKQNGITKVIADTTVDNIKSQNVLKRNGFTLINKKEDKLYFSKII